MLNLMSIEKFLRKSTLTKTNFIPQSKIQMEHHVPVVLSQKPKIRITFLIKKIKICNKQTFDVHKTEIKRKTILSLVREYN